MKLGQNFAKVRAAIAEAGLARPRHLCRARHHGRTRRSCRSPRRRDDEAPYFSIDHRARAGAAAMTRTGAPRRRRASAPARPTGSRPRRPRRWREATDIVGYGPYVDRVPDAPGPRPPRQRQSRRDGPRARMRSPSPPRAARVAVVSGGDPGVFAMAAAVFEAIEGGDPAWRALDIARAAGHHRHAGRRRAARRAAGP